MLTKLQLEFKKARHRKIFLFVFGILLISTFWISFSLSSSSRDPSLVQNGYYHILYQFPLMNTLLLPLFIAVLASRIWDTENKGHTYKLLCTMEKRSSLYHAKTLFGALLLFLVSAGELLVIKAVASAFHIAQPLPVRHLLFFFFTTFFEGLMLYLLQQIISFRFENQLGALTLGLIGSFGGLFSLFFPKQISLFIISSYFATLQTIGMDWDRDTRITTFHEEAFSLPCFLLVLVLSVVIYFTGKKIFAGKEL